MKLDDKVRAALALRDAIEGFRTMGMTDEQIIDLVAKVMAETLPERS